MNADRRNDDADKEIERRRDEVVKRMLNTPPQPRQAKRTPKEAKGAQGESSVQEHVARQSEAFLRSGRRVKALDLQKLA